MNYRLVNLVLRLSAISIALSCDTYVILIAYIMSQQPEIPIAIDGSGVPSGPPWIDSSWILVLCYVRNY